MAVLAGTQRNATVRALKTGPFRSRSPAPGAAPARRKLPAFGQALDATYRKHGRSNLIQEIAKVTDLSGEAISQLDRSSKFRTSSPRTTRSSRGELANRLYQF